MEVASLVLNRSSSFVSGDMDIMATIRQELHAEADPMGQAIAILVQARTPVRTGALRSDIGYEPVTDMTSNDIVYIYAEGTEQLAEWNRIYVQYQEGPPLGEPTYTNAPHEMFLITAQSDGFDVVEMLGTMAVDTAIVLCIAGLGVPA